MVNNGADYITIKERRDAYGGSWKMNIAQQIEGIDGKVEKL